MLLCRMEELQVRIINHTWTEEFRFADGSPMWEFVEHPVRLIFADPPYNYRVRYEGDDTGDSLPFEQYQSLMNNVIRQCTSMLVDGGTLWWLCPAADGWWVWNTMRYFGELLYGQPIIWYERFSQYQKRQLTKDYRLLFALKRGSRQPVFNGDDIRVPSVRQEMGDPRADPAGRVPGHVWTVSRLQGNARARVDWHPAQLPPVPLERIVRGWTRPGETVLDAFAGSGSMGDVCKRLDREFVGVDGSKVYCAKMEERLR